MEQPSAAYSSGESAITMVNPMKPAGAGAGAGVKVSAEAPSLLPLLSPTPPTLATTLTIAGGGSMGINDMRESSATERKVFGCSLVIKGIVPTGALAKLKPSLPCGMAAVNGVSMREKSRDEIVAACKAATAKGGDIVLQVVYPPAGYEPEEAGASPTMSTPRPVSYAAGLAARFSTAATQLTGEGLVEYGIFMDPKSLTKIPKGKGCWGKLVQCVCTCVGGYENNKLKHMKEELFPKLDGPVFIYDINSKEGDTFVCMNNRDANGNGGVRRVARVAGGLFQRNVLYKLLVKEQTLVPNADWAEEHERSEINEILALMQLTGAIAVNYEHRPSATQIGDIIDMPIKKDGSTFAIVSAYTSRLFKMFSRSSAAAAASALRGQRFGITPMSSLSGRVLFRSNEKPVAPLDSVIADMGTEFFHIRSQPAVMAVLNQRMGRGIQMAVTFTFKHYTGDCALSAELRQPPNNPSRSPPQAAQRPGSRPCTRCRWTMCRPRSSRVSRCWRRTSSTAASARASAASATR